MPDPIYREFELLVLYSRMEFISHAEKKVEPVENREFQINDVVQFEVGGLSTYGVITTIDEDYAEVYGSGLSSSKDYDYRVMFENMRFIYHSNGGPLDKARINKFLSLNDLKPSGNIVDHPDHYNMSHIEVIDAIEAWQLDFHLGSVVKYIARAPHKGTELEDISKAHWYLTRYLNNLEEQARAEQGD